MNRAPRGRPRPAPVQQTYYAIDPTDPPPIREVARAWTEGRKARDDRPGPHALYPLLEILRDARPGNFLREPPGTPAFDALLGKIRQNGLTDPLLLMVDRDGRVVVGEGNHRTAVLLALHPPGHRAGVLVPVRFHFRERPLWRADGLTWATFRDPARFYREPEPKPPGPAARRKAREATERKARIAARAARVPSAPAAPAPALEPDSLDELMALLGVRSNPARLPPSASRLRQLVPPQPTGSRELRRPNPSESLPPALAEALRDHFDGFARLDRHLPALLALRDGDSPAGRLLRTPEHVKTAWRVLRGLIPDEAQRLVGRDARECPHGVVKGGTFHPRGATSSWTADYEAVGPQEDGTGILDGGWDETRPTAGDVVVGFRASVADQRDRFLGAPGDLARAVGADQFAGQEELIAIGPIAIQATAWVRVQRGEDWASLHRRLGDLIAPPPGRRSPRPGGP